MLELLEWAQLLSDLAKQTAVENVSNTLLLLYVITYVVNRKGCFLVAFIICELLGNTSVLTALPDSTYYMVMASVYCCLYCFCISNFMKLKVLLGCVIMVLFQIGMSLDAKAYNGGETFIYTYYVHLVISIHLYIMCSLFKWERIRTSMVDYIRSLGFVFRYNDTFSFFWYNIKNTKSKS